MDNKIPSALFSLALVTTLLLTGCQAPLPSSLSDEQVVQVVDSILKAFNAGDFVAATQSMSDEMKKDFTEVQFVNMAAFIKETSGNYVSCTAPLELSNNASYAVYRLPCSFETGIVTVSVAFFIASSQVEGLYFDSATLRTPTP
jgi:hypothetical protein